MNEPDELDPSPPRPFERWLKDVHDADPGSVFPHLSLLRDADGRTSYDIVVAEALAATAKIAAPTIVDLGSGDGILLALYGAQKAGAHLVGVEQSPKENELAHATLRPFDAEIVEADVRTTGLPSAIADAVVSHMVLMLLDNADEALAEAARILKPGGTFIAVTGTLAPPAGVFEPVGKAMARALESDGKSRPETDQRFRSEASMRTLPWETSGFVDVTVERITISAQLTIDQLWAYVAQWYPAVMLSEDALRELEAAVREEAALRATGGIVDAQIGLGLLKAVRG